MPPLFLLAFFISFVSATPAFADDYGKQCAGSVSGGAANRSFTGTCIRASICDPSRKLTNLAPAGTFSGVTFSQCTDASNSSGSLVCCASQDISAANASTGTGSTQVPAVNNASSQAGSNDPNASGGDATSGATGGAADGCPSADFTKVNGVCVPTSSATGGLSDKSIPDILTGFASSLLEIFGVLAIIAFVVSGAQYLLATGDEKEAEVAKKNLKYSVIAVVVALSGVIIINAIEAIINANPGSPF